MEQLGFDFGVSPRRLMKVTPARLSTFDDCPRRYRLAYVDRPTPQRTGPWAHSTLGAVVHNALRALFDLPAAERTPARAAALVGQHWKDAGFADPEQAAEYRRLAKDWAARYVAEQDLSDDPRGVERWVSAPAAGGDGPASMIVEGRADRIDERDGELVVVDYKTGRRPPDEHEARSSQALALYAVAAERTLHTSCRHVELHHLPSGTVAAAEHTSDSLRRQLTRAEETATELQQATDELADGGDPDELFPARTGRRCCWCDFRPSCPAGQQAGPAARSWDLLAPLPGTTADGDPAGGGQVGGGHAGGGQAGGAGHRAGRV
ncbi:PD-(D/E)XK nuclease family protein [Prauserella halophila]|uniref:PD-(D/E)XK nuclease family protein n=1 Tax=Prauserella halophila TaxID=185641 RepID=A0ABN1WFS8_9PSEU|nr:PD-(D/E)XK nuclease family protein [Prauserella halophila]MCP2238369.1 RecB family exonuclease [Prauserella halophila]